MLLGGYRQEYVIVPITYKKTLTMYYLEFVSDLYFIFFTSHKKIKKVMTLIAFKIIFFIDDVVVVVVIIVVHIIIIDVVNL